MSSTVLRAPSCWANNICGRPGLMILIIFFFNDTATTEIYTLSLHDALPILSAGRLTPLTSLLAAIGLLCVLTALLGRGQLAGPSLFTLATEYTIVEVTGHAPAASVIAYAAGLIVVSELLLWAAQLPRSATADRAVAT